MDSGDRGSSWGCRGFPLAKNEVNPAVAHFPDREPSAAGHFAMARSRSDISWKRMCLCVLAVCALVVSIPVFAGTPKETFWSGQATCSADVQSAGYAHAETQTWTIIARAPTMQGQMQVYPGVWGVSGKGSTQRPVGAQALQAAWTNSVPGISAPIAVFYCGFDKRLVIKAWHSQLRQQASIRGTRQVGALGAMPAPSALVSDTFEWQFPTVEGDPDGTTVSGSGTVEVAGGYLPLQPTMASTKATCKWEFTKGALSPTPLPTAVPLAPKIATVTIAAPARISSTGASGMGGAAGSAGSASSGAAGAGGGAGVAGGSTSSGGAGVAGTAGGCPAEQSSCSGQCVDTSLDLNNCGSCGNKCSVTNGASSCSNGSCGLPPDSAFASGPSSCGTGTASVSHQNGIGQAYNDCGNPLATPGNGQTYNRIMAFEAASAFTSNPAAVSDIACAPAGLAVTATANGSCAVWVYTGKTAGHVNLDTKGACTCPGVTDKSWN